MEWARQLLSTGCGNDECIIRRPKPGAMVTNSGCKCASDLSHYLYGDSSNRVAIRDILSLIEGSFGTRIANLGDMKEIAERAIERGGTP